VSPASSPARRITGVAVLIGLVGAALATLALLDVSAGPSLTPREESGARPAGIPPAGLGGPAAGLAGPAGNAADGGPAGSSKAGRRLLTEAADADAATPYVGVQFVSWLGPYGSITSVVRVWHERNRSILAQVTNIGSAPSAPLPETEQDPDGILSLSRRLLNLMCANYRVAVAGDGQSDGRAAQIVELRRPDGSLAARFWLDATTKLPLRREIFGSRERIISEDAFIDLRIGDSWLSDMPDAAARSWSARLNLAQLATLRAQGWPLPAQLPGSLRLVAAHRTNTTAGPVVDLDYSDGLSVVSVFLQRGQLPGTLPGWQEIAVRGRAVYSADPELRSLAWSARGFVYTVIAGAPPATVDQVVDALPHDTGPGFWGRIERGLRRLGSMANPFR
jgi:sigma-E factor negative regulatory protein RseB